ncbi:hypothetical protein LWI29_035132 [Acer saccharum]|uniref:Uncharacterized protein n=1 Tax=Acer saccharum TaxID=4024 RepID=A0AA39RNA4_ACESA|nr:hypothetical protein LWI29_035132 [Acer saccharum]
MKKKNWRPMSWTATSWTTIGGTGADELDDMSWASMSWRPTTTTATATATAMAICFGSHFTSLSSKLEVDAVRFPSGRSFAEVVKDPQEGLEFSRSQHKEVIQWEESLNDDEWLNLYAIGILKAFSDTTPIINRLCNNNIIFSSNYIGDNNILWKFNLIKERDLFVGSKFLWEDCFSSIENWSSVVTPQVRLS